MRCPNCKEAIERRLWLGSTERNIGLYACPHCGAVFIDLDEVDSERDTEEP